MKVYTNQKKFRSLIWKANDFRLFFFHLGPLIMFKSFSVDQFLVELFLRLSKAIRLLIEQKLSEAILTDAENHLKFFLTIS